MRPLPPLKALRAFEAAARHMSFKLAADELSLTPTVISHQIQLLESVLGESLFRRRPRPLTLTSAGAALFPAVRDSFDSIAEAFGRVRIRSPSANPSFNGKAPASGAVPATASPPHLSLVVLPFVNLAADHEEDYFADGITESLTVDLSRISGAFVIARNTAFSFRGKTIDLRQVGRDLNVRYALEGSVQRRNNPLRRPITPLRTLCLAPSTVP